MGMRTFIMMSLKWVFLFGALLASLVLFINVFARELPFFDETQIQAYVYEWSGPIVIGYILIILFLTWLEYQNYSIYLNDDGVKIRRGILSIRLNGVAYHRIRDVVTHRSFLERILGISTVSINLLGDVDETMVSGYDPVMHLPYLDKHMADNIHNEIFDRLGDIKELDAI